MAVGVAVRVACSSIGCGRRSQSRSLSRVAVAVAVEVALAVAVEVGVGIGSCFFSIMVCDAVQVSSIANQLGGQRVLQPAPTCCAFSVSTEYALVTRNC